MIIPIWAVIIGVIGVSGGRPHNVIMTSFGSLGLYWPKIETDMWGLKVKEEIWCIS